MLNMIEVGRDGELHLSGHNRSGRFHREQAGDVWGTCKQNDPLHQVEALYTLSLLSSLRTGSLVASELLGKCW